MTGRTNTAGADDEQVRTEIFGRWNRRLRGQYTALGAVWDVERAGARLRAYGVRPGRPAYRARPATRWEALTPTEVKVAYLVADGRSNPDVAVELFLSRNTVQTHVSHILAKLGARSRAEIIREAMRHPPARRPATALAGLAGSPGRLERFRRPGVSRPR